jgi:hypothetical protein
MVIAGFAGAGWRERMATATAVLRRAAADVAAGREAPGIVGPGLHDWSTPATLNPDDWWCRDDGTGRVHPASPAQIAELRRMEAASGVSSDADRPTRPLPGFAGPLGDGRPGRPR